MDIFNLKQIKALKSDEEARLKLIQSIQKQGILSTDFIEKILHIFTEAIIKSALYEEQILKHLDLWLTDLKDKANKGELK